MRVRECKGATFELSNQKALDDAIEHCEAAGILVDIQRGRFADRPERDEDLRRNMPAHVSISNTIRLQTRKCRSPCAKLRPAA